MVPIDEFEFRGLIGNRSFKEITGPAFDKALAKLGWRQAPAGKKKDYTKQDSERTKAHIFLRLRGTGKDRRGESCGIFTPNDFARALRGGRTIRGGGGAKKRVCVGPNGKEFHVVYREVGSEGWFVTLTFPTSSKKDD